MFLPGLSALLALLIASVSAEHCYEYVDKFCGAVGEPPQSTCNSSYSGVASVKSDLQHYAATHLEQNFQYLLMSAYFGNYEANREGFAKLYRKLADDTWEDSIDLIKYMAKRGFNMDYRLTPRKKVKVNAYKMNELQSLGFALDMQKLVAEQAHEIHSEVTVRKNKYHDAETINFIEKEFVSKHADTIRDLAGHFNDLQQMITKPKNLQSGAIFDPSLAIYLFDEHLKKVVG